MPEFKHFLANKFKYIETKILETNRISEADEIELANQLINLCMGSILTSIQQSDFKNKRQIKLDFLNDTIDTIRAWKEHRKDLDMKDDE
jgi:hypothetical protein